MKRYVHLLLILLTAAIVVYAHATGPDRGYTGAPGDLGDCTACHDTFGFANVGPGSVAIGHLPTFYQPGQSYTVSVSVQDPNARRWGFELTSLDSSGHRSGTFTPLDSFTQIASTGFQILDRQYIEHTEIGTFAGTSGGHTWNVQWTAPSTDTGTVKFYVAGNAANNDGTNQNDYIYTNGAVLESPSSFVTLALGSDPVGQTLQAGSLYTIKWTATNLSNVESFELRYSTDNGATFPITNLIFSTTDSSVSSHQWAVPNVSTGSARIRVLAATQSGSAITVLSGRFSISGGSTGPAPIITSASTKGKRLFVTGA
ncbi:MAG: choice-of-anchor V domain-containing protein, partial [Blastocatellia bacterium]